jgi:hypothetical protein
VAVAGKPDVGGRHHRRARPTAHTGVVFHNYASSGLPGRDSILCR